MTVSTATADVEIVCDVPAYEPLVSQTLDSGSG